MPSPCLPEDPAARRAAIAAKHRANMAAINGIQVPGWVKRAGLESDFRDTARDFGEDAALRHCRRMTAEMRKLAA